jgi:hypothetical protein
MADAGVRLGGGPWDPESPAGLDLLTGAQFREEAVSIRYACVLFGDAVATGVVLGRRWQEGTFERVGRAS